MVLMSPMAHKNRSDETFCRGQRDHRVAHSWLCTHAITNYQCTSTATPSLWSIATISPGTCMLLHPLNQESQIGKSLLWTTASYKVLWVQFCGKVALHDAQYHIERNSFFHIAWSVSREMQCTMHSTSQKNLVLHLQSKTACQPELLSHMHQHAGRDAHHVSPNLEVKLDSISRETTCDGAAITSDASLQSNYLKLARYVAENVLKATFEKLPFEKMFDTNMAGYCLNFTVLCEENNYFIA